MTQKSKNVTVFATNTQTELSRLLLAELPSLSSFEMKARCEELRFDPGAHHIFFASSSPVQDIASGGYWKSRNGYWRKMLRIDFGATTEKNKK